MTPRTLEFRSELAASADAVWAAAGTMAGVNYELGPWLRMTFPQRGEGLRIEDAPVGENVFVSWILLGGVLPFDRHVLRFAQIVPGRGFDEDSTSWTERRWQHQRRIEPLDGGRCRVTDRLIFEPRGPGALAEAIIRRVFAHRHARLRQRHGVGTA
jgi:hypothetical protein